MIRITNIQIKLSIEFIEISMTDLINNLKETLQISVQNQTEELKKYQLYVCNELLRIKKNCTQRFNAILQKWLQITFSMVIQAINQQHNSTIRKKIEEIFIDVTIKQKFLLDEFRIIENKCLSDMEKIHMQGERKFERQQSENKMLKEFYQNGVDDRIVNNRSITFIKGRSLSTGLTPKRSLSKISIFAESKKIVTNSQQSGKLATKIFQKQINQTMKKSKKRNQNCFTLLQKTMSNTSPSNFMLNYMNKQQQREEKEEYSYPHNHPNKSNFANQKQMVDMSVKNLKQTQKISEEHNFNQNKCQQINEPIPYEKLVLNLQQKISHKLDQLMNKYSKIQQKLIPQQSISKPIEEKSKKPTVPISIPSPKNIKPKSENMSSIQQQQKCEQLKSIEMISGKAVKSLNTTLVNKGDTSKKIVNDTKSSVKSINAQSKIIRNKKRVDSEEESIEVIKLQKQKQRKEDISDIKEKNKLVNEPQKIVMQKNSEEIGKGHATLKSTQQIIPVIPNKQYIQTLILSFERITGKLLLPISKKLLHSLKVKYQKFCKKYETNPLKLIIQIESEEMQKEQIQLKELLMKMEKILNLKCEAEKRQKIKLYINSFLLCWLSFNQNNEVIVQEDGEVNQDTIKNRIKEVIKRLNI